MKAEEVTKSCKLLSDRVKVQQALLLINDLSLETSSFTLKLRVPEGSKDRYGYPVKSETKSFQIPTYYIQQALLQRMHDIVKELSELGVEDI